MLSQEEADKLIAAPKRLVTRRVRLPAPGNKVTLQAEEIGESSGRRNQSFMLDVYRGKKDPSKFSIQLRAKRDELLVRVDVESQRAHPNPPIADRPEWEPWEEKRIPTPHLQRYVEGYRLSWAVPLPTEFSNPADLEQTFRDFLTYCNFVDEDVEGQRGLL